MSLEKHIEKAREARAKGYNCCQCVLLAFGDELGLPEETAAKIGAGLGAGVGGTGEICGVVTGMGICQGMCGSAQPEGKGPAMRSVNTLAEKFRESNGHLRCRDLKGKEGVRPCDQLIEDGVRIFHNHLHGEK